MAGVARVVLDSPLPQLDRLFDYRIPDELAERCVRGVRVKVPLRSGARMAEAYVVEVVSEGAYPGELSPVEDVISYVPVLAPEVWDLARAVADRAAGVASDVLRLAIPPRQVRVEKAWASRSAAAPAALSSVTRISDYPSGLLEGIVAGGGRAAVTALPHPVRVGDGAEPESWVPGWARSMAQVAAGALASDRSAIIAVPDFRDVADAERAARACIPAERIVRFDGHQSNAERAKALLQAMAESVVVIGSRSAMYAPATRLGVIAMWDDGDASFVEQRAPYVHSRDVALVRAAQSDAALLFFAHARSTDVQRLVEIGWVQEVHPARPVTPKVVPTAQQTSGEGFAAHARIPSSAWQAAREASKAGPVLVQVAAPGFASGMICAECGEHARCQVCAGPIGLSGRSAVPQCRFCGALATEYRCPSCGAGKVKPIGNGAERTAEDLGRAFPGTRIIVADGAHPIDAVDGRPAIVVATRGAEPSAPGGYACALLLDGERMLAREGLRVQEDVVRFWANAATKVAAGASVYLVGVGGRLATAFATWRLDLPASAELADRRALQFPPAVRVATLTGTEEAVATAVERLGDALTGPALGPVPVEEDAAGMVRCIVRFPYARGAEVAGAIKAEVIRGAGARRVVPRGGGRRQAPVLRARLDDLEPFVGF